MSDFILDEYFTCSQIKNSSTIWRWNLNNTPSDPTKRILILAQLINQCESQNQTVYIKPDKRIRAKGLCVLFANTNSLEE